ncbi:MAG: response regulator transcription factor [Congregibacter sp.]
MRAEPGTQAGTAPLKQLFHLVPGKAMSDKSSASATPRILLVEDDADIARLVTLHLEDLNAEVVHSQSGDYALTLAMESSWNAIILDLRLPGQSGLDVCRALRVHGDVTPILMRTAKSSELDRVLGLELGADDYLTKPFSPLELCARVKALLRRAAMPSGSTVNTAGGGASDEIELGPFWICTRSHRVKLHGEPIELTSREFDLLLHFARQPGRVFRRTELLDEVWGYGHDGYEHTVNTHINRLRRKIENDPGNPVHVETVWGVGYRFQAEHV